MIARVAGVGQESAGDDGVGLVVARALRAWARGGVEVGKIGVEVEVEIEVQVQVEIEVHEIMEPSRLIPLLETTGPFVIVDAVLGPAPGTVLVLEPAAFEKAGAMPLTTHGVSVAQAVGLARALYGTGASPFIRVVGIGIALPEQYRRELSAPVEAAVPRAVAAIVDTLRGC